MERRIGVVRKWTDRGFGFIKVYENSDDGLPPRFDESFPDVFLHWYPCKKAGFNKIEVGEVLEFDLVQNAKGINAANVAFVQRPSSRSASRRSASQRRKRHRIYTLSQSYSATVSQLADS